MNSQLLETLDAAVGQLCENANVEYTAAPTQVVRGTVQITDETAAIQNILIGIISASRAIRDDAKPATAQDPKTDPADILSAIADIRETIAETYPETELGSRITDENEIERNLEIIRRVLIARSESYLDLHSRYEDSEKIAKNYRRDFSYIADAVKQVAWTLYTTAPATVSRVSLDPAKSLETLLFQISAINAATTERTDRYHEIAKRALIAEEKNGEILESIDAVRRLFSGDL